MLRMQWAQLQKVADVAKEQSREGSQGAAPSWQITELVLPKLLDQFSKTRVSMLSMQAL